MLVLDLDRMSLKASTPVRIWLGAPIKSITYQVCAGFQQASYVNCTEIAVKLLKRAPEHTGSRKLNHQ
jgi:hypothetical protein